MKFVPKPLHKTTDVSRGDRSWQSFLKNALGMVIVLGLIYLGPERVNNFETLW